MPVCYPEMAGELYQPSNGTEGEMFFDRFCWRCQHESEETPCEIMTDTMVFDTRDAEYPREWKYDDAGRPTCTKFARRGTSTAPRCEHTPDMFDANEKGGAA